MFFEETRLLPAIGLTWEPNDAYAFRASYSQTIARQTFKELSPILQQEFAGGPVFIGNPELVFSEVDNFDLRMDYRPYDGALVSVSYFLKNIEDAIEFVQRDVFFKYTTAVNYPSGRLSGFEFEVRQDLSNWAVALEGIEFGLNATFIQSKVVLPQDEQAGFSQATIQAPISFRDMTNAPEHLYNLFLTYDVPDTGTSLGLFYTVTGDALVEGAGQNGQEFFPDVYATEFGTLNLSLAQRIGKYLTLSFKGKNLTNPEIETVFRSKYIGDDILNTRNRSGIDLSVALSFDVAL